MKRIFLTSLILIFIISGFITIYKYDRLKNFYRYVFFDETYVNRTFYFKRNIAFPHNENFKKIIYDNNLDDSRGHYPNFEISTSEQLTVPSSQEGIILYTNFIKKYLKIIDSFKKIDKHKSDKLAFEIMGHLNEAFLKNEHKKRLNLGKYFLSEKDYRSEDFIYFVINEKTGCGETGEAMVSLLRGAGFKARLLRYSHSHNPIMANHIFPEFYSFEREKWIMLEPMINFSPSLNDTHVSAIEMINSSTSLLKINESWKNKGAHKDFYNKNGLIWFNKKGIITNFYYSSGSNDILEKLKHGVNHGP